MPDPSPLDELTGAVLCASTVLGNVVLQTPGPYTATLATGLAAAATIAETLAAAATHALTLAGGATVVEAEAGGAALVESSDSATLSLTPTGG